MSYYVEQHNVYKTMKNNNTSYVFTLIGKKIFLYPKSKLYTLQFSVGYSFVYSQNYHNIQLKANLPLLLNKIKVFLYTLNSEGWHLVKNLFMQKGPDGALLLVQIFCCFCSLQRTEIVIAEIGPTLLLQIELFKILLAVYLLNSLLYRLIYSVCIQLTYIISYL